jgi:hypothetical protein
MYSTARGKSSAGEKAVCPHCACRNKRVGLDLSRRSGFDLSRETDRSVKAEQALDDLALCDERANRTRENVCAHEGQAFEPNVRLESLT